MQDNSNEEPTTTRRMLWTGFAFYGLVAFEFFYMASPFAAWLYTVYGPGLDLIERSGWTGWTIWFFLPHAVAETRSVLVNLAVPVGMTLLFGGILAFAWGVFVIYRAKLQRRGAVMGGVYANIRHPQYLSLIISSLGMLLIWPRFLVLFGTVTMIVLYAALARAEERICLRQYPEYRDYLAQTGMFLPRRWTSWIPEMGPRRRLGTLVTWIAGWLVLLAISTTLALSLRAYTVASLYTVPVAGGVGLSVTAREDSQMARAIELARVPVEDRLNGPLIVYLLPTNMYVSEIPMGLPEGETFGHSVPRQADSDRIKVIFTRAEIATGINAQSRDILWYATNKHPLGEVHVNLATETVEAVLPPPEIPFYPGVQVPVF